ncbi:tRNA epoxyqueuosine(34) reductase QueG [Thermoanaerobacterium sp. CMT5567-10]|uniref:tRNA epoxyqueuosine(34) reductase QueG n=1 Tax=Thermoanaerobacterium sp. CMT5567-10 TaxID=3061989 RepID=UPI0026DFF261|nr:tRNA epoxyqueuosine(34) reductase QueG [Thermoanaerobacterium sp. CMT5567-10]WKV10363.1 tRNA epoxyqueuosine(34) reductase QueG [Thermoanaerobacterium sp. CMT5567-10]
MTCVTKNEIREFAYKSGIDIVGFASPDCLFKYRDLLTNRYENGLSCNIEENDIEKRINPYILLEDVKSIISVAVSYNVVYEADLPKSAYGTISRTAWGVDYHRVLINLLEKLRDFILSKCKDAKAVLLVDNNPLLERAIAYNAGIGFYGKNNMIINEKYGSYLFLGEMLLNIYFEPDKKIESKCGSCRRCLKACPGKALIGEYKIDANKCLSYATIKKGYLSDDTIKKLGIRIYGCDTCQDVCPFNKTAKRVTKDVFIPRGLKPKHDLREILSLDKKKFQEVFGPTSASWRGKNTMIRNAIIAAINSNDKNAIEPLKSLLSCESSYLRGYSAYALSILDGKNSLTYIEKAYINEKDEAAKEFMKKAIINIRGEVFEDNER